MIKIFKAEDLDVYKRSYKLALEIHKETLKFPYPDKTELGGQIRRSAKSIPSNITEGFSLQNSAKQYIRYLNIAKGSTDEIFTHLRFAYDLGYLTDENFNYFFNEYKIVVKQLSNLIKKWLNFPKQAN